MSTLAEKKGYFGEFGGSFVPAELQNVLTILTLQHNQYLIAHSTTGGRFSRGES